VLKELFISYQHQVTSTSDLARQAVKEGKPAGTSFRAGLQTRGRGRHGRHWESPEGNLYVSIILYPVVPEARWPEISLITGLALLDAIRSLKKDAEITLKWPNDVLIDGLKCAGILLEREGDAIIVGCGVNLDAEPRETSGWVPGSLNRNSTTDKVTAEILMKKFEQTLISRYNTWEVEGFERHRLDWTRAAAHIGAMLAIDLGQGGLVHGIFDCLSEDGALMLRSGDGVIHRIQAGDVISARLEEDQDASCH